MKQFIKNSRAATAIEFAFILPVLLLLLLGIVQFGLTLFFDSSLNSGIRAAGREGVTEGYTAKDEIEKIMNAHLGGLYDKTQATLVICSYSSFSNMSTDRSTFIGDPDSLFKPNASSNCSNAVPAPALQSGQIILYGVKYNWGQTFGVTNPFLPKALYSFSIVRNELFNVPAP